jgi:hypothetical protein
MSRLYFYSTVLALLLGCASTERSWPREGVFRGTYTHRFEVSRFVPEGTEEEWWLSGRAINRSDLAFKQTFLVVCGKLSDPGEYGHFGAYDRELVVEEVLEVGPKK